MLLAIRISIESAVDVSYSFIFLAGMIAFLTLNIDYGRAVSRGENISRFGSREMVASVSVRFYSRALLTGDLAGSQGDEGLHSYAAISLARSYRSILPVPFHLID